MNYLVIGGSGFIGSTLCLELMRRGHKVANLDIHEPFFESELKDELDQFLKKEQYTYIPLDYGHERLTEIMTGYDGVFHLGGVLGTAETFDSLKDTATTNIVKTINVFEAIKLTNMKAVYIGIGNDWENPYTITKVAAARFALMFNREFHTKITVVRGLNVYGPRQKWFPVNKYFPRFVVSLLEGKKIPIFGDGEQIIDVVYVGDVADALIKAMETDFGAEQYQEILDAGTGHGLTVNETVKMIVEAYDPNLKFEDVVEYKPLRPGEPIKSKTLGNTTKINEILGFVPKTDMKQGIKESVDWYRKFYKQLATYAAKSFH